MAPSGTFQALLLVLFAVPSFQQFTDTLTGASPGTVPPVSQVNNHLFYPYGQTEGDTFNPTNDDGGSPRISISFSFPYFDHLHDSLWVNTNGVISFLGQISQFTPDSFPLGDGRRLIAPFWGDVDTRRGGDVMYRETNDPDILARATTDITTAFPDMANFQASWTFVATWHEVGYYGSSSSKRNTFQVVLVSSGRQSFAIFNYGDITWTTGTASGGSSATGLGGTPAQVGFNAGDGMRYFSVPGSQTAAIVDIETTSNVNLPGRWVFRIDSGNIQDGGCNTEGTISLFPFFGTMLGGTKVVISGPCFAEDADIRCKFGTKDPVPGWVDSDSTAVCISPFLSNTGRIPLMVSTDGGTTYNYSATYTSVNPDRVLTELTITENADDETMTIEWQPSSVEGSTVNVHLHEFNETTGTWDVVAQLASGVPNTGSYTLSTADGWIPVDVVKTGTLSVTAGNEGARVSRALPVIIFVGVRLLYAGVTTYVRVRVSAAALCRAWCEADSLLPDFLPELSRDIPCPTTLNQARGDVGRFEVDEACDSASTSWFNCFFHPGAHHCVRSIMHTSQSAGQQCCYKQDGSLLTDGPGRGTPDRIHPDFPLVHYGADVHPYILCCKLSDNCDKYFEKRPANDGTGYVFPWPTRTWGDPHMITLDGVSYTFNGAGEFVLLTVNNGEFLAQARMEQLVNDGSAVDATIITALAMKENSSETVQLQLSEVRTMDILVDGELMDFQDLTVQEFSGFTVTVEEAAEAQIAFDSGIGVTVSAMEDMLSIAITLPRHFRGHTLGLLGKWNGEPTDDLTTPDGTVVATNSSTEDIHYSFGLTWMIDEAETLFTYGAGESYSAFSNTGFTPAFELPSVSPEFQAEAEGVCGTDNHACLFDVLTTGRLSVANVSIRAIQEYTEEIEELITCSPLDPPDVPGTLIVSNYSIGSVATFECEEGELATPWERVCQADGTWSDAPPPVCESCGPLEPPDVPGTLIVSGESFGSVATFECEVGILATPWERVCQEDSTWSDAPPPVCECKRPYKVWNGICIRVVSRPLNYAAAVAFCRNTYNKGELLPIRDPAVVSDVKRHLLRRTPRRRGMWAGLADSETEGTWIWQDGVAYGAANIPGNSATADCAYMAKKARSDLRAAPCGQRKAFICKR